MRIPRYTAETSVPKMTPKLSSSYFSLSFSVSPSGVADLFKCHDAGSNSAQEAPQLCFLSRALSLSPTLALPPYVRLRHRNPSLSPSVPLCKMLKLCKLRLYLSCTTSNATRFAKTSQQHPRMHWFCMHFSLCATKRRKLQTLQGMRVGCIYIYVYISTNAVLLLGSL